jgi:hypothetical protein
LPPLICAAAGRIYHAANRVNGATAQVCFTSVCFGQLENTHLRWHNTYDAVRLLMLSAFAHSLVCVNSLATQGAAAASPKREKSELVIHMHST